MTNTDDQRGAGEYPKELSRRRFLKGTGRTKGAALASAGIYELIDTLAHPPERTAFAATAPMQEQYIVQNLPIIQDNGSGVNSSNGTIPVVFHPLHDHVITATLKVPANANALQEAQQHLESVLLGLEQQFPPTPTGLGIAVAWGLPYFHQYIPSLGKTSSFFPAGTRYPAYLPVDLTTSQLEGKTVYAVQEAMTFPSDQSPAGFGSVHLEQNEVAVLLRSDSLTNIMAGMNALFGTGSHQAGSLFNVTSIRRGFTGGVFYGHQNLPSRLALAANLPGAKSIPPHAEVFLGFTTSLQANLGPGIIANLETLPGVTDQWPHGYFRQGTTMQLSHLFEDLATWYGSGPENFSRMLIASGLPSSLASRLLRGRSPLIRPLKVRPLWCKVPKQTIPTAIVGVCSRLCARRRRRPATTARSTRLGRPFPRAAISTRWTIRSSTPPIRPETGTATSQPLGCTSLSSSRRLGTSIARGSLWTVTIPIRPSLSPRAPTTQASTRSCSRPTGRTTWFLLVAIAPSRSPSSWPDIDCALKE